MLLHLKDGIIILSKLDTEILCENCDIVKTIVELDPLCDEIWLPMISCEIIDLTMVYLLLTEFLDISNVENKIIEIHYLDVFGILEYYLPNIANIIKYWPIKEISTRQGFLSKLNDNLYHLLISHLPSNVCDMIDWPVKYIKLYLYDGDPEKLYQSGYPSLACKIIKETPHILNSSVIKNILPFIIEYNHIKLYHRISINDFRTYITQHILLLIVQKNRLKMLEYLFKLGYYIDNNTIQKMYVYACEFKQYDMVKYIFNKTKIYLKESYNNSNNSIHY